jgi:hypothetical protein
MMIWKLIAVAGVLVGALLTWEIHQHGRYQPIWAGGQAGYFIIVDTHTGEWLKTDILFQPPTKAFKSHRAIPDNVWMPLEYPDAQAKEQ